VLARRTLLAILLVSVAAGAAGAAAILTDHGLTDLFVYRWAGDTVLHGSGLYGGDDPVTGLPFTYPPFAALLMVPLAVFPSWCAAAVITGLSTGALATVVVVARRALGRTTSAGLVVLLTAGAFALEPVWQNAAFGQVNTLLMLAVVVDLHRPDARWSGVLLGIAAGVKLTPLVFVVLLVLVGRRTSALRAVLVFLATVVVGFVVMPRSATAYWTDGLLDSRRVGPSSLAHNQSIHGVLTRFTDGPAETWSWLLVAGPLAVAILLVAARCWRRGEPLLGIGVAALAMLLASPISWSHHWVWAVPVALALWERSRRVAVAWTAVFVARPILWPPWGERREYDWSALDHVIGNAYVLAAVAVAAGVATTVPRRDARRRSPVAGHLLH
jgi:alpha-1,2-mannosyltransferase